MWTIFFGFFLLQLEIIITCKQIFSNDVLYTNLNLRRIVLRCAAIRKKNKNAQTRYHRFDPCRKRSAAFGHKFRGAQSFSAHTRPRSHPARFELRTCNRVAKSSSESHGISPPINSLGGSTVFENYRYNIIKINIII